MDLDSLPGLKEEAALHYDAESFAAAHAELSSRWSQIVTTITGVQDYDVGRTLIGRSLHTVQARNKKRTFCRIELRTASPAEILL